MKVRYRGEGGRTRLQCSAVVCMETFKDFQQVGRFTLRDEGKIITEVGYPRQLCDSATISVASTGAAFEKYEN